MKTLIRTLYYFLLRFLLSLRYRIHVEGIDHLKINDDTKKNTGILFLANHPAEVDPCILSIVLAKFHPTPIAIDYLFHNKFVRHFLNQVNAIAVPNFENGTNSYKKWRMEKTYESIYQLLRNQKSVLIYPSGGLKKQAKEVIGGSSGVHTILQNCPETQVVLVRTLGLWGSSFSKAQTGVSPNLLTTGKARFIDLLKNGIFFAPRRDVHVTVAVAPSDFPKTGTRLEINRYLENWYNQEGEEPLSLIPYVFWSHEKPKAFETKSVASNVDFSQIPKDVSDSVKAEIARLCRRPQDEIQSGLSLAQDLGLDSLDLAQLGLFLKDTFGINNIATVELVRVGDVEAFAAKLKQGKTDISEVSGKGWKEKKDRPSTTPPLGKTIQEAFLRSVDRMDKHVACADLILGQISYQRLKIAVLIIAEKLKEIPGDKIGIMLPASISVNMVILAALMAKKIPVMINWTLGSRNLQAVMEDVGLQTVISSYKFLDKLENIDLNGINDHIILLEDLLSKITLKDKIQTFCRSFQKASSLLKTYDLESVSEDDPAVILFTSGTEALPKSVPLSHKNILYNQKGGYQRIDLTSSDVLLGALPPFHSFGFSVTGLFPILAGMRVIYFPNPIDGKKIAQLIDEWKITLICIVPTFLKNVLRAATPSQLKSLRVVVTGAEKTPQDLFEKLAQLNPKAVLAEGYGITECGPILTLNPIDHPPIGVGQPLEGVEIAIVDLTTYQRSQEGLILVRGPNIFKGYYNSHIKSPFVELEGKLWYNTGDLGYLKGNHLVLSGRLKRFVKIGGEMISLGAIEETLLTHGSANNWKLDPLVPTLAVIAKEEEGKKSEIYLMTTIPISADEANEVLKVEGMSNLIRISQVRKLVQIPLLGSGKIDYKTLSNHL